MPEKREITRFQRKVYDAAILVPKGKVTTYGLLAKAIGCGSCRAVGQALRRNPFAPKVPCHRVIATDLSTGGFQGQGAGKAVQRKLRMLKNEGVEFLNGKLKDPARIFQLTSAGSSRSPRSVPVRKLSFSNFPSPRFCNTGLA